MRRAGPIFWLLMTVLALSGPATARKLRDKHLSLRHAASGEQVDNLWVIRQSKANPDRQWVGSKARKRLEHFLRDIPSGKTAHVPEKLLWRLYLIGQHFDAPIEILTGLRPGDPDEDRHKHGHAVDFRVVGVDSKAVWQYATRFPDSGAGYYPKADFVHLDLRDRKVKWTAGKRSRCRDAVKTLMPEQIGKRARDAKRARAEAKRQAAAAKKAAAAEKRRAKAEAKKARLAKAEARKRKKSRTKRGKKRRRIKRYHMHIRHVNTKEEIKDLWVVRYSKKNRNKQWVGKKARKKLEHFLRDIRHKKTRRVPERLLWQLYLVAQHFDAPVEIVSGYRSRERRTSRHRHAKAVDFRIEGVDPREVWNYCKRFKRVGLGYYPTSRFVHMDVRDKSAYWIDDSGPGEKARYRSNVAQPKNDRRKKSKRRARKKKRKRAHRARATGTRRG